MYEADGIILASPVYYANVSAELKMLMDRTQPVLRYAGTKYKCGLGNKVGGGVVSAYNRNGGAETTLDAMHHFMFIHDMIIVGTGLVFMDGHITAPGSYFGGAGITWNTVGDFSKEVDGKDVVLKDELGVRNTRSLGSRVAQVAKCIANALPVREDLIAQIKSTTKLS
jgi:multimeric flavodoxin WrbA